MIFAAINWLSISINLLLVVFVIVCLLMALLILMQRPKQEGLGAAFGGGVTDQVFGARTTNVLQKGTVYLGSLFFIISLTLAILLGKQTKQKSLLEPEKPVAAEVFEEAPIAEEAPEQPTSLASELPVEVVTPDQPAETVDNETPEPTSEEVPPTETTAPLEAPAAATPEVEENKANKSE